MIVSVHLPKTAGSSFARALETHFGARFLRDYGDLPLHRPPFKRKLSATIDSIRLVGSSWTSVECIHGHFLPAKYRFLTLRRSVHFVTWLRDPVERLASHYQYWRRTYDPRTSPLLHRRVVEDDWSFDRFALAPDIRNIYTQFLWSFPLSRFAFVGITERYAEDFRFFTETFLGVALPIHRELANDARDDTGYAIDPRLRMHIEAFHETDMRLYRRALARRRPSAEALSRGQRRSPGRSDSHRQPHDG